MLQAKVWGVAYEIPSDEEESTVARLNVREQRFERRRDMTMYSVNGQKLQNTVLVYLGSDKPELYLGEASLTSLAEQIAKSHGPSGANSEYLLKLATFMRSEVPEACDDHLFELEAAVKEILSKDNSIS